jgi:AmiR/NasT family two-component response regulator
MKNNTTAKPVRTLLLVDDDRLILSTLSTGLKAADFVVYTAESVDEAEIWLDNHERPDLVILDMYMPNRPGLELSKRLNEMSEIPFIFLTAFSEQEIVNQANLAGAMSYLVKPVTLAQVIPAIETAIARAEELKLLRKSRAMLQTALDADRAVSVAVGIVMDRHLLSHDDAFELIRKKARSNHLKLIEVASTIINACEQINIVQKSKSPIL